MSVFSSHRASYRALRLAGNVCIPEKDDTSNSRKISVRASNTIDSKPPVDPSSLSMEECDVAAEALIGASNMRRASYSYSKLTLKTLS